VSALLHSEASSRWAGTNASWDQGKTAAGANQYRICLTKVQEIHAARQTVEVELGGRSRGAGDAPGGRERGRSQVPIAAGECRLTALAGKEKALGQSEPENGNWCEFRLGILFRGFRSCYM
jgi:hypothetical protein